MDVICDIIQCEGGRMVISHFCGSQQSFFVCCVILPDPVPPTDNPFIESFFSTLKDHPTYPGRFETFEATQSYRLSFFPWYNHHHLHGAIGFVIPADKHFGKASTILELRMQKSCWARQRRLLTNQSREQEFSGDSDNRLGNRQIKPSERRKRMANQKKLFDEIFELALQNDMKYLG
jgi:hypothetical protein